MRTALFVGGLPLVFLGCSFVESPDSPEAIQEVGQVIMPLVSESSSGQIYQLSIDGYLWSADGAYEREFSFYGHEESQGYIELAEGGWMMMTMGWDLQRMNEITGEFYSIDAELTSGDLYEFYIMGGDTTSVTFQFQTADGDTPTFEEGGLNISFEVDDGADADPASECGGAEAGTEVGDCATDFEAMDQSGVYHQLYDNYRGDVVVLQLATSWDAPSRAQAESLNSFYNETVDYGVEVITVLVQNIQGENATSEDLGDWIDLFDVNHTVLADEDLYIFSLYNTNYSIPSYVVMSRDMRIQYMSSNTSIAELEQVVWDLL